MRRNLLFLATWICAATLAACSGSGGGNQNSGGSSNSVSVTVAPASTSVVVGQKLQFLATVTGSSNTAVTWQVNSVTGGNSTVGTITTNGLYTGPAAVPSPPGVSVIAVSQADSAASGSASVTIVGSNSNQLAQSWPILLGTSGGNELDTSSQGNLISCCGGTLGSLVERNGTYYILSNNHVLARSDQASTGEAIIQPGLIDANCTTTGTTTVADLSQFVSLEAAGTNVDAALAQIVSGAVDTSGNILSLGATASGTTPNAGPPHAGKGIIATIGEAVAKSGRTTGLTCSTIDSISLADSVSYQKGCNTGATFSVNFTGQISVAGGSFSNSGDSGSLIVDQGTADPVALLYGGSDTDTVGNPVADVLKALADAQGNQPTFVGSAATHNVIGCTLPSNALKTVPALAAGVTNPLQLAKAARARDLHAPELLAIPSIESLSVGPSVDHPGEAAVLLFVNPGLPPAELPVELEGVRTRIVTWKPGIPRGLVDPAAAASFAPVQDTFAVTSLSGSELLRAKTAHAANVAEWMTRPGVQGFGITSSADVPGQAALMIFLIRGVAHDPIPVTLGGVRTRIRESSRFTAGHRDDEPLPGCRVPAPAP